MGMPGVLRSAMAPASGQALRPLAPPPAARGAAARARRMPGLALLAQPLPARALVADPVHLAASRRSRGGRLAGRAGRRITSVPLRSRIQRKAIFDVFFESLVERPAICVGLVVLVVSLGEMFEAARHAFRGQVRSFGEAYAVRIAESLFKEIKGVGFISLLFILSQESGAAQRLSSWLLDVPLGSPEARELSESFELTHIIIFMLLAVLLVQAAAILAQARSVSDTWDEYERTRAFGASETSLETRLVRAGYLARMPNPAAPRGTELLVKAPFKYGESLLERVALREDPLHKLVLWRAIRHEFMTPCSKIGVSSPSVFSFESYLCTRLERTLDSLVEVDIFTWCLTLVVLTPMVYFGVNLPFIAIEGLQCAFAWLLLAAAAWLTVTLEEETYALTPPVPEDPIRLLQFFDGTSSALRGATDISVAAPGLRVVPAPPAPPAPQAAAASGLAAVEAAGAAAKRGQARPAPARTTVPSAGAPSARAARADRRTVRAARAARAAAAGAAPGAPAPPVLPGSWNYEQAFRLVAFFQAMLVTSLIVTFFSEPLEGPVEVALYGLAWAEWPLMLFLEVPTLVRRLTLLRSIDNKDEGLVRRVVLQTKEGILRDYFRVVFMLGSERRAAQRGEPWTLAGAGGAGRWSRADAAEAFERGLEKFRGLPQSDKIEVWKIFASWDIDNSGSIDIGEFADRLSAIGIAQSTHTTATNLTRWVDHDGTQSLTWRKFKALMMLATEPRQESEMQEDMETLFRVVDHDKNGVITIDELANWSTKAQLGMCREDFDVMVLKHFGRPKQTLRRSEFRRWVDDLGAAGIARDAAR